MRVVRVPLADRAYRILIGRDLLPQLGAECTKHGLGSRCAVISDRNVAKFYADAALKSLVNAGFDPVLITVPAGETSKSLEMVGRCFDRLAAARLERKSFVVALGGGVIGDLAGFVAAAYLRGIPFVQVPTTLLAQVDSSVGGKVGVNLPAGKNLVGAFHQPRFVLCDLSTLDTLPKREFRAGLGEVIKYGIIFDAALFRRLERDLESLMAREEGVLAAVVGRCCAIKAHVVACDEKESGLRAVLNFGHTIGHALEAVSGYGRFLHGEAISIGQVAAAHISESQLGLLQSQVDRIRALLANAGLPTTVHLGRSQVEKLMAAMRLDKKVSGGEVRFVLAKRIGKVEHGHLVPAAAIRAALERVSGA
ncbi:MAG: 3-dehydroquinate synthase [Verrucomicrobiia bacterium]